MSEKFSTSRLLSPVFCIQVIACIVPLIVVQKRHCFLNLHVAQSRVNFLLKAYLASYIPEPAKDISKPFLLPIEDVFSIAGRGTIVTGRIERGIVEVGDALEIVGLKGSMTSTCQGVEKFRKPVDAGPEGDGFTR